MPHANMDSADANAFRTEAGRCVVTDGTVRVERRSDGLRRAVAAAAHDPRAAATVALGALAVPAAVPLAGAVALGVVLRDRVRAWRGDRASVREIPLDAVAAVAVADADADADGDGRARLARPRLVVRYRDADGRRRRIALPARSDDAAAELDRAIRLFQARGVTVVEV